jgi:hypothetical protein
VCRIETPKKGRAAAAITNSHIQTSLSLSLLSSVSKQESERTDCDCEEEGLKMNRERMERKVKAGDAFLLIRQASSSSFSE